MEYLNTVMKRIVEMGIVIAILLGMAVVAFGAGDIYQLTLNGTINPVTKDIVKAAIAQAEKAHAELLIIELNTPGGLGESMRDIVMAELASTVPIVVFVGPAGARAASAGAIITMAANIAAMAPGTNIGAAHPVELIGTGGGSESKTMTEKVTNDAVAFAKSVAQDRGRNVTWAEKAVRESSSLTAQEALDQGVINLIAADIPNLVQKLNGYTLPDGRVLHTTGKKIIKISPSLRERLLGYLVDPNIVYVLFLLGLYGLIFEFFHPGIGFGLVMGGICLTLAFFGMQILPVNVTGVILILFGVVLMVLDAFTPTHGILTTGGVVSMLIGSFTLFNIHNSTIGLSWVTIILTVGTVTALFVFIISKALLIQRKRPVTGHTGLVGKTGTARSYLDPTGKVFVHGEYWDARSAAGTIAPGERIIVERVEGLTLVVRKVK